MRSVDRFDYGPLIIGFCIILFFVMVLVTASELAFAQQPLPRSTPHIHPIPTTTSVVAIASACIET